MPLTPPLFKSQLCSVVFPRHLAVLAVEGTAQKINRFGTVEET